MTTFAGVAGVAGVLGWVACVAAGCGTDAPGRTVFDTSPDGDVEVAEVAEIDALPEIEGDANDPEALFPEAVAISGTVVLQGFGARGAGLFAAPMPAADLFAAGRPVLGQWPGVVSGSFVATMLTLIESSADGASTAGAVFFPLSAPLAETTSLPSVVASTLATSPAFLVDVEPTSPKYLQRVPVMVRFAADGGPYGAPNLLTLVPIQGIPLRPATRYAAVVMRAIGGDAAPLGRSEALAAWLRGLLPNGLDAAAAAELRAGLAIVVRELGVDPAAVAGFTVFRTAAPAAEMGAYVAAALAEPAPDLTGLVLAETYDRFCVYAKTVDIPDYQHGEPPYSNPGEGRWQRDANDSAGGAPAVARRAPTRLFITVPRSPPPVSGAGYPGVVFIRAGGGGDRPLIDRGPRGVAHGEPIVPHGTGPAMNLAAAGWAGVTWDGPHGGPRNPSHGDEQFLMFNVLNPGASRDNVRQTALEAIVVRHWLSDLRIDASDCPGVGTDAAARAVRIDLGKTALMGHSMGGWVAPLAAAHEPGFGTVILSGAGGSWIENVVYKQSPVAVAPVAEAILGYDNLGRALAEDDVALTLLQWAGDPSDPQNYGALAMAPPRDVIMIEGIVDTYILPPIANATSLALGLDVAGPTLDDVDPRLSAYTPLGALIGLVGRAKIALPARANRDGRTAVVLQSPGDAIEDGHEAMFQTDAPKFQIRCMLGDVLAGKVPTVRAGAAEWAACD